jgi:hypothetical protein
MLSSYLPVSDTDLSQRLASPTDGCRAERGKVQREFSGISRNVEYLFCGAAPRAAKFPQNREFFRIYQGIHRSAFWYDETPASNHCRCIPNEHRPALDRGFPQFTAPVPRVFTGNLQAPLPALGLTWSHP